MGCVLRMICKSHGLITYYAVKYLYHICVQLYVLYDADAYSDHKPLSACFAFLVDRCTDSMPVAGPYNSSTTSYDWSKATSNETNNYQYS